MIVVVPQEMTSVGPGPDLIVLAEDVSFLFFFSANSNNSTLTIYIYNLTPQVDLIDEHTYQNSGAVSTSCLQKSK